MLKNLFKKLFCLHSWKIIKEETLPSTWEELQNRGMRYIKGAPSGFFERQRFTTLQCEKCGRLKRYVDYL